MSAGDDAAEHVARSSTGLSVVLPIFDEEAGLERFLGELTAALASFDRPFEIVAVDDGSRDGTPAILARYPHFTVVRHGANRGYGAALKAGIRAARYPLVAIMDADGTYVPSQMLALVEACDGADMAIGARVGVNVHASLARGLVKWCFRQYARYLTRQRIPDLNSGLRVFHRHVAERFEDVLPDGFSFTTTITVASLAEGFDVKFLPVDYRPRVGHSKIRPIPDTLRIGRQLLRLGIRFSPWRTSVSLAAPLVGVFALLGMRRLARARLPTGGDAAWLIAAIALLGAGRFAEARLRRRREQRVPPVGSVRPQA